MYTNTFIKWKNPAIETKLDYNFKMLLKELVKQIVQNLMIYKLH